MLRRTPLYEEHVALGASMQGFAGYEMPIQYPTGIAAEHLAVRQKAGLFDVSHMGEFILEGPTARQDLDRILTNRYSTLKTGRVRYSPMCLETGGCVDDLLVYALDEARFMLVVNASNREKDWLHLQKYLSPETKAEDISDQTALIALQGPKSQEILSRLVSEAELPQVYYSFVDELEIAGVSCLVSRTGYTGEWGYEIYHPAKDAVTLWRALLAAGGEDLLPAGLGARDTLRLEAAMPLYGHEMDEQIDPLTAGLAFAVKMDKEDFIGREALEKVLPLEKTRVGLKVRGRGIVREGMPILDAEGQKIGQTSSGSFSPSLEVGIAMGYVPVAYAVLGSELKVEVRGRQVAVEVVGLPFVQSAK